MCDEYEDERTVLFWRRLEELDRRQRETEEAEAPAVPLGPPVSGPGPATRSRPRVLTR